MPGFIPALFSYIIKILMALIRKFLWQMGLRRGILTTCARNDRSGKPMTKVEAVMQPSRFAAVRDILMELGVEGITISDVRGHGRQKGHTENYRGREYAIDLLPKIRLEIVVPDDQVEIAINAILTGAATGKIGDGKIFLSKVNEVIRIRNQERGSAAL